MNRALFDGGRMTVSCFKDKERVFIITSLHCVLGNRQYPSSPGEPQELFLLLPKEVAQMVTAVGFCLQEGGALEVGWKDLKDDTDIVLFKVDNDKFADSEIKPIELQLDARASLIEKCKGGQNNVSGYSHSSSVTGTNCRFNTVSKNYQFMMQTGEGGNSGTLMFLTTKSDLLSEQKDSLIPLGVFKGATWPPHKKSSPRGVITPFPDSVDDLEWTEVMSVSDRQTFSAQSKKKQLGVDVYEQVEVTCKDAEQCKFTIDNDFDVYGVVVSWDKGIRHLGETGQNSFGNNDTEDIEEDEKSSLCDQFCMIS
jgi:hypothetical protein